MRSARVEARHAAESAGPKSSHGLEYGGRYRLGNQLERDELEIGDAMPLHHMVAVEDGRTQLGLALLAQLVDWRAALSRVLPASGVA